MEDMPPSTVMAELKPVRRKLSAFAGTVLLLCALPMAGQLSLDGLYAISGMMESPDGYNGGVQTASYLQREKSSIDGEYLRWGGLLASVNPRLTREQVQEAGRAIARYSRYYNLPPSLVVAVIMVESSGRLDAVSPKGARGLMQVMPWWTETLKIKGDLFSIDTNIRVGCHILSENIGRWGYKEGILRYYRGSRFTDDSYFVKVQRALRSIAG